MIADPGAAARPDDISGALLDGAIVSDLQVIDRVRTIGSLVIVRGPTQRLRRSAWAAELSELARARGVRVSIRDSGRVVLVLDVDWDGWVPIEVATDDESACDVRAVRAAHPSRSQGPRLVPCAPTLPHV